MNVSFTKLISSAAAVLAASSAFAQTKAIPSCPAAPSFEQGYGVSSDKFPAAYNAAARVDTQNSWNIFTTASFLYWYADQEGMDYAIPTTANPGTQPFYNASALIHHFEFKPGFQVGLGMNFDFDNWVGLVEYTWFHQSTLTQSGLAPADTRGGTPIWGLMDWFIPNAGGAPPPPTNYAYARDFSSKWRANFDIIDATLCRPSYQGRKLTILPFGGLRAAWIRQNIRVAANVYDPAGVGTTFLFWDPLISHNRSKSWAVGPRAGFQGHWLLGYGFRMEGDVSGSILFTRYVSVTHREDSYTSMLPNTLYWTRFADYNTIRPMADLKVGLGWGSYFSRQNYHIDFLATYDFSVLWGQNMIRPLISSSVSTHTFEALDLHLQGLTATARLDF
jgi:hypothetical protein